jgi:hypothetical protein
MSFCVECGAQLGAGPACEQCGRPVAGPDDATRQLPIPDPTMVQPTHPMADQPVEPPAQTAGEPVSENTPEPPPESASEPAPEPASEPNPEPASQPATESASETPAGPATEPSSGTGAPAEPAGAAAYVGADAETSAADSAATQVKNPFADIGLADYARDVVALILLIATFGMPWDYTDAAADKIHVVLATLLAMSALTLPYLKRGHVLPGNWGDSEVRIARMLAVAPYVVIVAVTIVIDIVSDDRASGGIGIGVAFGLAGAVLTAQARVCELGGPDDDHDDVQNGAASQAMVWHTAVVSLAGLAGLLTIVRLVFVLSDIGPNAEWTVIALAILGPLLALVVLAVPAAALVRRYPAARTMVLTVGAIALVLAFWRLSEDSLLSDVLSVRDRGPEELLWLAAAAAAAAPGLSRLLQPASEARRWLELTRRLLGLTAVVAILAAGYWALFMVDVPFERGSTITLVVLTLLVAAAAAVGRNSLRHDATQGRIIALAVGGVLAVLGIVMLAIAAAADVAGRTFVGVLVMTMVLTVAVVIVLGLTVPRGVRQELGPVQLGVNLQRPFRTPPDVGK